MPFHQMSELCDLGEDHEDPRENQDQLGEQLFWAEESPSSPSSSPSSPLFLFPDSPEEVASPMSTSPPQCAQSSSPSPSAMEDIPWSQSEEEGSSRQDEEGPSTSGATGSLEDMLRLKTVRLLAFLLLKYRAKELTTKAEMLSSVIGEHEDHFPEILSRAAECLQLLFGVDVKEVDPSDHSYVLATTLGLTYDGVASDGHIVPTTGLLVLLLCIIAMEGECVSEEKLWKVLNDMGVHEGCEHYIYGEPRELITKVWVEEQYVEYRQVAGSDPARYEFLWGPRAHAETTRLEALEFMFKHTATYASYIPSLS